MPRLPKSDKAERKRIKLYHDTVAAVEQLAGGGIATGQTIVKSRLNEHPFEGMKRRRVLDVWEETAANDIMAAFALCVGAPVVNNPDLAIRSEPRHGGADASAAKRVDLIVHYQRWRRELANTPMLSAAIAVLLDERSPRSMDRELRQRSGATMERFREALQHFAEIRGNTQRRGAAKRSRGSP